MFIYIFSFVKKTTQMFKSVVLIFLDSDFKSKLKDILCREFLNSYFQSFLLFNISYTFHLILVRTKCVFNKSGVLAMLIYDLEYLRDFFII